MRRFFARIVSACLLAPMLSVALVPAQPAAAVGLTVQDQTTAGITPTTLAQSLAGAGVTISNVTYAGTPQSAGQFQGGSTIIGFESGVILSSGWAKDVVGPNTSDSTTRVLGTGSDAQLSALSGFPTLDKTVLEFDVLPQATTLTFQYVFASEEYNEYANTQFNDVFAFFINGVNCALVPVTGQPVSINTINGGNPFGNNPKNPALYRNNDLNDPAATIDTQVDGLTVVLTCTATVNAGVTNHIKLAIADASDPNLDSYVFLKAGSFVSSNITLAPETDENPTGTDHTVTATVTENGQPAPGKVVTFTVTAGPHVGTTGTGTTNASGQATFTYTGVNAGTDSIKASYLGPNGTVQESNTVTKIWKDEGAKTLTLAPKTSTNPVGTQHCVTATALNAGGGPAPNVIVKFSVTGSIITSGSGVTDANGEAEFCYTGPTFPGADSISAFADNNKNGTQDPTEPSDTAAKGWGIPASTAGCKVTYGGRIAAANGDKATFGGNAEATGEGQNQYIDHGPATPMNIHTTAVLAVVCDATTASIYADAGNGVTARIDVKDLAEPGRADTYRIRLSSGYDSGEQTLQKGGNIQIHFVAGSADTTGPKSASAVHTIFGGFANTMDTNDEFQIVFDEPIILSATATIRVTDADCGPPASQSSGPPSCAPGLSQTVGDAACGSNASCALSPDGTTLTVTMTGLPIIQSAGSIPGIQYPAVVTETAGITDAAGNSWDFVASPDRTIGPPGQ